MLLDVHQDKEEEELVDDSIEELIFTIFNFFNLKIKINSIINRISFNINL
jgi:hypothetical protein